MRYLVVAIITVLVVGCVKAPSELRQQEPHAQGASALDVAAAAHCLAGAATETWAGFASSNVIMAPSGESAEVQISTNYLVGVADIAKSGQGSRITVWLHHGWNFPVTDGPAAAREMVEGCGGAVAATG